MLTCLNAFADCLLMLYLQSTLVSPVGCGHISLPQVDRWLQPYLQLTLTCLAKAENRLLKDELLVCVANALYYNAAATLQILQQMNAVQQLFGVWFGFIFERRWAMQGGPSTVEGRMVWLQSPRTSLPDGGETRLKLVLWCHSVRGGGFVCLCCCGQHALALRKALLSTRYH